MAKYKKIQLNMKQKNLEKLLFSYLSSYAPSRASVAKECTVSDVTSGKVANALLESGFMVERIFSNDGGRPCAHLFCRACANILVIDISSSIFKMSIANAYGEIKFHDVHEYDSAILPGENLYIFLSRCGSAARRSNRAFCAITVIYSDKGSDMQFGTHLPTISEKDSVTNAIYDIFGRKTISHITVSGAISKAIAFRCHGDITGGVSYVFIGDHLSLFNVSQNGSVTVCSAGAILSESERTSLLHSHLITKDTADLLFVRLCNFMGAAFSPSAILLESDICTPDIDTSELIIRKFALSGLNAPIIYTKNNEYPLHLIGAIRNTLFKILKIYITSC